jgi:hypothetical protein
MSVKYQHPDYDNMITKWERCTDVCAGQDAVHKAADRYLPRLTEQTDTEYKAYRDRTPFYNATWRTIVGLQGMLFRKPPRVDTPESMAELIANVDQAGTPLHMLALEVTEIALKMGRLGIFVDFPIVPAGATGADRKRFNPTMKIYTALSIINWKTKTVDNVTKLSMVVLKECVDVPKDEFEDKEEIHYRVLDFMPLEGTDGVVKDVYRVRVFKVEMKEGKEEDVLISTAFPQIEGETLDELPFYFIGVDDISWKVDEPPLIDLVDMNLSHYRTTADYEHGCHFTGLPTPVISGYVAETNEEGKAKDTFCIGSMTAWVFPRPEAKASYLEFTGQGLGALEKNLTKKENYMAVIGARMLEAQSSKVESADTAAIHHGGEQSMLSSVAQAVSMGIEKVLKIFCRFAGAPTDKVKFELNRDFFPIPMDALTLTAIIAGWQNQAYSYETMFENLRKGEIVPVDADAEKEQKAIKANPPPMQEVGTTPGNRAVGEHSKGAGPKPAATPATLAPTSTQLQNNGGK